MAWFAVFDQATGELRSVGDQLADSLPAGLVSVTLAARPDFATQRWNATTRALEALPAVVIRDRIEDFMAQSEITALSGQQQTRIRTAITRVFNAVEGRFYA